MAAEVSRHGFIEHPARVRRLNVAALVFLLHVPAAAIGMTGTTIGHFIPFAVAFVPAMLAWAVFLQDITRNPRVSRSRARWLVAAIAVPQVVFVYWWLYVRPWIRGSP